MADSPGASRSSDLGLRRQYSNSNQERIDGILEAARRRSIAMGNTNDPALHSVPRQSAPPRSLNQIQNSESPPVISPAATALDAILAETESSADEETSIVRRESQRRQNRDYSSTAGSTSLRARQNSQTSMRRTARIPSSRTEALEEPAGAPTTGTSRPWWKITATKYRSIELENKGSVARDHLALGTLYSLYRTRMESLLGASSHRTNIPSVATDFPWICLDWYRDYAAFSSQCHHWWKQPSLWIYPSTSTRKASRSYLSGYQYGGPLYGIPPIF